MVDIEDVGRRRAPARYADQLAWILFPERADHFGVGACILETMATRKRRLADVTLETGVLAQAHWKNRNVIRPKLQRGDQDGARRFSHKS